MLDRSFGVKWVEMLRKTSIKQHKPGLKMGVNRSVWEESISRLQGLHVCVNIDEHDTSIHTIDSKQLKTKISLSRIIRAFNRTVCRQQTHMAERRCN